MSGQLDAVKSQGKAIVFCCIIVFIFCMWFLKEYIRWRINYTDLHKRVSTLETYHKN